MTAFAWHWIWASKSFQPDLGSVLCLFICGTVNLQAGLFSHGHLRAASVLFWKHHVSVFPVAVCSWFAVQKRCKRRYVLWISMKEEFKKKRALEKKTCWYGLPLPLSPKLHYAFSLNPEMLIPCLMWFSLLRSQGSCNLSPPLHPVSHTVSCFPSGLHPSL